MPNDGPCAGQGGAQAPANYIISSNTEMWDKQHEGRQNYTGNKSDNIALTTMTTLNVTEKAKIIIRLDTGSV